MYRLRPKSAASEQLARRAMDAQQRAWRYFQAKSYRHESVVENPLVQIVLIQSFDTSTGLYTATVADIDNTPAFHNTTQAFFAYDYQYLEGLITKAVQRLPNSTYVLMYCLSTGNFIVEMGTTNPQFYTYQVSADGVRVSAGKLMRGVQYAPLSISQSAELTVVDGDKGWLERTAANVWEFAKGASYPTDKLYFKMFTIGYVGGIMSITRDWTGGNITHDNIIRVSLTEDGSGVAGGEGNLCTFKYTVKTDDATIELMTGATPKLSPARIVSLTPASAATNGTLHIDSGGNFILWDCDETQNNQYTESKDTPCDAPGL